MNKEDILRQLAQTIPPEQLGQMAQQAMQQFAQMPGFNPKDLDMVIQTLAAMLDMPDKYPQMRADLIQQGVIDGSDLPEQFSPEAVGTMLLILLMVKKQMGQATPSPAPVQQMAHGGLSRLAAQGRGGDTMLAHINPQEAMMLKAGRQPSINPTTGLPEYGWFSDIFKVVAPLALNFFFPGAGTAIGAALGASAAWAPVVGGALIGAGTSALTGGNPLKGAITGGLGAGGGELLGSSIGSATGWDMSPAIQSGLGNALAGGASSALTGGNFFKGAAQGAMGSMIGNQISGLGGTDQSAMGQGLRDGGKGFSNMMGSGYTPKESLIGGALTGLAGLARGTRPSDIAAREYPTAINQETGETYYPGGAPPATTTTTEPADGKGFGLNMRTAALALPLLSMMSAAPDDAKQAVSGMSPQQQEYFNRPTITWNWDQMRQDAGRMGQGLGQYMAQNWNTVQSGKYNNPTPVGKAMGGLSNTAYRAQGGLSQIAYMVKGGGTGRSDTVEARLSDGEYVMDAETVAMLGDGSTKAGGERLDMMRANLRQHKGKELARGRFSPNSKSPLAYLKGAK